MDDLSAGEWAAGTSTITRPQIRIAKDAVRRSMDYCYRVTRRQARNFYYGLKLTPQPKRSALYVVYAFMRACDDLADEPGVSAEARVERIDVFRKQMHAVLQTAAGVTPAGVTAIEGSCVDAKSLWPAFRHVMQAYSIDPALLDAMLDGQASDLTVSRYPRFEDLYGYCYKVASVVGLVCISIWGYRGGHATRKIAEHRGVALQLTNILRDLVEDAGRQRLYLPEEDLDRFGLTSQELLEQIRTGRVDSSFDRLMAFEIERARSYYQRSAVLESLIEPACRSTSWVIMRIYRGLLEKIARNPRAVLRRRVALSWLDKAAIVAAGSFPGRLARRHGWPLET